MDLFVETQKILPQKLITGLAGILASVRWRPVKNWLIDTFIRIYNVDMSQARALSTRQFEDFNAFFTRELRPGARPLPESETAVVSPADGVVSQAGSIVSSELIQAKGKKYDAGHLVASSELGEALGGGQFATVYLSPRDYHRVHMPIAGQPVSMTYVPGKLFSVNDRTAKSVDGLFARNERLVTTFEHETGARFVVVMVGAMIVGGMATVLTGSLPRGRVITSLDFEPRRLERGDEFGRFFLGSTVILLCPKDLGVTLAGSFEPGSTILMGQEIGSLGSADQG